jgi:hypothetical protein
MDQISVGCHGGDTGRYDSNLRDAYHAAEKALIAKAADLDVSVIIDRMNINAATRQRYIRYWKDRGGDVIALDFGPGDPTSLHRRVLDGRGMSRVTWAGVHKANRDRWEEPSEEEGIDLIEDVRSPQFRFYAIDFDGGVVKEGFPGIGEPNDSVIEYMRLVDADLESVLIVWTSRTKDYLWEAREFLLDNNIPFDYFNENPLFLANSRKIWYDVYVSGKQIITPEKLEDQYYRYEAALL